MIKDFTGWLNHSYWLQRCLAFAVFDTSNINMGTIFHGFVNISHHVEQFSVQEHIRKRHTPS